MLVFGQENKNLTKNLQRLRFRKGMLKPKFHLNGDSAFILTTGINSAYVLGYSGTVMVPLGWVGGSVGLVLAAALSLYVNVLLAKIHELGGKRHIRCRDLAGYIYGKNAYALTWAFQYLNLFMINIGYIILDGQSLKAMYVLFWDDHLMKLPYFIVIAGFVCALFSFPLNDEKKASPRDYNIPGSIATKIFSCIGGFANLFFSFNTGMLPELQATVKQPVVGNMVKALVFQFTIGLVPMYAIPLMGYWAYGNETSAYLLNNVSGPVWVKAVANISSFLQSVIALPIFESPMYEYLDTKFGPTKGGAFSLTHISFRVLVRGGYLTINTIVSALLPSLGDFMSLTGAFSTLPLTFILANHMYLMAKKHKLSMPQKSWHWLNIAFFSVISVAAWVSAVRLILADSKTYNIFADL
ncbi:hypothetical protein C5167_044984 [Papaver somniferum]|uniref:Amino acid transporter transmembrane domain-containing protein n=1 Tax=Papaver somniferum TaxID=3469 RepID=A0A4Y7LB14_PAPSO|nr:hypothetical protein C5167_044984 [Papaver somniferum]